MATVYKSKTDVWIAAIFVFAIAGSLFGVAAVLSTAGPWWSVVVSVSLGVLLPSWLLFGTTYRLESGQLLVRSGPFKWRVPVASITSIAPTRNPLSSPALSLDRLRIEYARGQVIMISPRNKDMFLPGRRGPNKQGSPDSPSVWYHFQIMTRRQFPWALVLLLAACAPTTEVEEVTSERWVGDVGTTNMMLVMTIAHRGTTPSDSGGFTALLVPGSAMPYTISGNRRADTLDLLLKRPGEQVHFAGWYLAGRNGLIGTLSGGDSSGTTLTLRRQ